jgi:SAM-dependent methyltransferase
VVLDIGSGTGRVVNKIYREVGELFAVETYPGFSRFIDHAENVTVINANLEGFAIRKSFDLAVATAVMQYFPQATAHGIYCNVYEMLRVGGKLIARNHVGLHETVRIEKSDELQADYFAEYRHLDSELRMLHECGFSVELIDAVPAEHNVWDNTKHFYFVCTK